MKKQDKFKPGNQIVKQVRKENFLLSRKEVGNKCLSGFIGSRRQKLYLFYPESFEDPKS